MNRRFVMLGAPLALAACSGQWATDFEEPLPVDVTRTWRLGDVAITIPDSLTVSNANSYAPNADIVWHGDPEGDRRAQVAAIMEAGIKDGASGLPGSRPVTLAVTLQEFHAVTPISIARAPSAVHNISFKIQAFDSRSTEPLSSADMVRADLPAYTGVAAVIAAQEGQTQKVRITNHLAEVTRSWLGIGRDVRDNFSGLGR